MHYSVYSLKVFFNKKIIFLKFYTIAARNAYCYKVAWGHDALSSNHILNGTF